MHRPATAPRAPTQEALRHAQAGEIGGGAQLEEARPRRPRFSPCFDETGLRHRRFAVLLSGGDSLRVTGSRADAASVLVASQIIRPQGPPIEVDRRLEANPWQRGAAGGADAGPLQRVPSLRPSACSGAWRPRADALCVIGAAISLAA
jgi:hypothetical protein